MASVINPILCRLRKLCSVLLSSGPATCDKRVSGPLGNAQCATSESHPVRRGTEECLLRDINAQHDLLPFMWPVTRSFTNLTLERTRGFGAIVRALSASCSYCKDCYADRFRAHHRQYIMSTVQSRLATAQNFSKKNRPRPFLFNFISTARQAAKKLASKHVRRQWKNEKTSVYSSAVLVDLGHVLRNRAIFWSEPMTEPCFPPRIKGNEHDTA